MNTRILNRAGKLPEDGFYQIEAPGEHINHASRVVQVIDAQAVESIVNRFASEAKAAADTFAGQQIYRDHLGNSMENPTEALGWAMEIQNRGGLPYAKIDWTALGQPLIESKPGQPPVYKFFSTEYEPAECEKIGTRIVNRKSYDVVRPLRLAGLSLTNDPNNRIGQRPISNRNPGASSERDENQPTMKNLLKKMGLDENASEDAAIQHLEKITNRATQAEASVTTLKAERDGLLKDQIEADLTKYKNRIKPANVEKVRAQLISNRAGTIELLESMEEASAVEETTLRITNRREAKTPEQLAADKITKKEEERAAKISNRAGQLRAASPRLTIAQAYEQAEREMQAS